MDKKELKSCVPPRKEEKGLNLSPEKSWFQGFNACIKAGGLEVIDEEKLAHQLYILFRDKEIDTNSYKSFEDMPKDFQKFWIKPAKEITQRFGQCSKVSEGAEMDSDYLKDIIYCTTQYLGIPDKKVALLNKRLYDSLSPHLNHFFKEPESSQTPTNSGVSKKDIGKIGIALGNASYRIERVYSKTGFDDGQQENILEELSKAQAILNRINSSEEGK